jgi:hypothetical protein
MRLVKVNVTVSAAVSANDADIHGADPDGAEPLMEVLKSQLKSAYDEELNAVSMAAAIGPMASLLRLKSFS